MTEQEHKFGEYGFGCTVITAHYARVFEFTTGSVSLYEPIGTDREGNEINLLDVMEQKQPDIVEEMEKQRLNQKLYELMESVLSLREKEVLYLRYGLPGGTELTQKEVGKRLGISRSYVSRIEKRALLRLRDAAWG